MIKYDWEKIQKHCKNDPQRILWYLAYKSGMFMKKVNFIPRVPRHFWLEAKEFPLPYGESYLLEPEPLFLNETRASIQEVYDYVALASCRLMFDLRIREDSTLHCAIAKAMDINIAYNSLLTVENNYINFKYEQINTED